MMRGRNWRGRGWIRWVGGVVFAEASTWGLYRRNRKKVTTGLRKVPISEDGAKGEMVPMSPDSLQVVVGFRTLMMRRDLPARVSRPRFLVLHTCGEGEVIAVKNVLCFRIGRFDDARKQTYRKEVIPCEIKHVA